MKRQDTRAKGNGKKRMRILAVTLSVSVLFTTCPDLPETFSVLAAEEAGQPETETRYVSAFAALPDEVKEQTVPVGTALSELSLPDTLEAVVTGQPSEDTAGKPEDDGEEDSGENDGETGGEEPPAEDDGEEDSGENAGETGGEEPPAEDDGEEDSGKMPGRQAGRNRPRKMTVKRTLGKMTGRQAGRNRLRKTTVKRTLGKMPGRQAGRNRPRKTTAKRTPGKMPVRRTETDRKPIRSRCQSIMRRM